MEASASRTTLDSLRDVRSLLRSSTIRGRIAQDAPPDERAGRDAVGSENTNAEVLRTMLGRTTWSDSLTCKMIRLTNAELRLRFCDESDISLDLTHLLCDVHIISEDRIDPHILSSLREDDVITSAAVSRMISMYSMWTARDLRTLSNAHNVAASARESAPHLLDKLIAHVCTVDCRPTLTMFTTLRAPRKSTIVHQHRERVLAALNATTTPFYEVADHTLRQSIVEEWNKLTAASNFSFKTCASCERRVCERECFTVDPNRVDLTLLRNYTLPDAALPTNYDFALYSQAILTPKGMTDPWRLADILLCKQCKHELVHKKRMPKLCLANDLYYGTQALPSHVLSAFRTSSTFEKVLIARARGSRISFRFSDLRDRGPTIDDTHRPSRTVTSQRCIRGNILIMPQNSTQLNDVLPPPPMVIRDTVCAVFVGRQKPTFDNIGRLGPVLVRKSTLRTLIEFLVNNNPHYACDTTFHGLSTSNIDALFNTQETVDEGVPSAMEIGHISDSDALRSITSDYTGRNDIRTSVVPDGDDILMENVGYTSGDYSPVSFRDMKMKALSYCLNGGRFVSSRSGDRFVPDFENPSLLTWMFPHLDPWGIAGFHHPGRRIPLTMEEQLKYLLEVDGSPFESDADFAFVYFNILQKKSVCDSVRFRVKPSVEHDIVQQLLAVDKDLLERTISKFKHDHHYVAQTDEERGLLKLVNKVGMVMSDLPGTAGYKLRMRNEIRSLINFYGTPAFFVTINPSDIHNPLVRIIAGPDITMEYIENGEELTEWQRRLLVAQHPSVCAKFFHTIISTFIHVVLRHGRRERGLFGKCQAYYGTVEAQTRGTLHCHMLIWLEGHPNPSDMRERMERSDRYEKDIFCWLESLIKCELIGQTREVTDPGDNPLSQANTADADNPVLQPAPQPETLTSEQFEREYAEHVNRLVLFFNWHEHTDTCWKYLRRGEPHTDANCRMRMDGTTRADTTRDPDTGSVLLRRLHPRIANYNDLIMFLTKCNMDLKHIGSGEAANALTYYITDYITKPALPTHLGLSAVLCAINRTTDKYGRQTDWSTQHDHGALTILVNSMLSRQEISHQQVMSYLVGGGDQYTSHQYRLLYLGSFLRMIDNLSTVRRVSIDHATADDVSNVTLEDAVRTDDTEGNITLILGQGTISSSNQIEDYVYRPLQPPFDRMCLYEYVGHTEKITMTAEARRLEQRRDDLTDGRPRGRPAEARGRFRNPHHQRDTHMIRLRTSWVVPVLLGDRTPRPDRSDDERELWARTVMVLFCPWRQLSDLKRTDQSWTHAFEGHEPFMSALHADIIHNMNVLSECKDARDKQANERRERRRDPPSPDQVDRAASPDPMQAFDDVSMGPADMAPDQHDPASGVALPEASLLEMLDSALSVPVRAAIDRCFQLDPEYTVPVVEGTATIMQPEDNIVVSQQQATMKTLKRKRVPTREDEDAPPRRPPRSGPSRLRDPAVSIQTAVHDTPDSTARNAPITTETAASVIQQVIVERCLSENAEQLRAFEIVARHLCFGGPQLLMYIGGVGGTGKSYVVDSILRLFAILGRRDEILVSAPTGAAAILIGGHTIHSLTLLPEGRRRDLQELVTIWDKVTYLIIDEVSMISALFLSQLCSRLQQAKGVDLSAEDNPFGGINVIFTGDFGQLRPVKGHPLYCYRLVNDPTISDSHNPTMIKAMKGAYLWRLVDTVVMLKKNQRQRSDRRFADLLARVRVGGCESAQRQGVADDAAHLHSRLIQKLHVTDGSSLIHFRNAPVIVGRKKVRDLVNARLIQHHSRYLQAAVHLYHSRDTITSEGRAPTPSEQTMLWALPSTTTRDSPGRLPLFPGMKVMVQENIAFSCSVVNGARGVVRDIRYEEVADRRYPVVVYVHIAGAGRICSTVNDDVIPIFPQKTSFQSRLTLTSDNLFKITRTQLPLLPAYSYTDYKAQGQSLDHAIVDPKSALSLQGVYVMLSRVKTTAGLAVLRPFPVKKINERLAEDLRLELARLEQLDQSTKDMFDRRPDLLSYTAP